MEIARALATQPEILLLDEPAAGMNPKETAELMELIIKLRDTGLTIFLVEQNTRRALALADRGRGCGSDAKGDRSYDQKKK